jgi:hypothetical protein
MTIPNVLPRVAPDVAAASTPNAQATAHHADGAEATSPVFGSVLTLLLAHVTQRSPEAKSALTANDSGSMSDASETGAEDGTGDASTSMPSSTLVAGLHHGAATASLHANAVANEHSAIATPSALETAADAAIGDATSTRSDDATAKVTVAVAVPTITIPPNPLSATTDAHRSLELVVPELRERLDRVIERMESEFGYKVEVTETYRSQSRQNALYAQGRTEPGQVVTWTRASHHTAGRAADLVVDGSYDNPVAYDRLMRIAREEGLRTLGPRDPGHVELPASGTLALARGSAEGASVAPGGPDAIVARPARSVASQSSIVPGASKLEFLESRRAPNANAVAQVATVAAVATVAQVAQVAGVTMVGAQSAPTVHAGPARARGTESAAARGGSSRGTTAGPVAVGGAGAPAASVARSVATNAGGAAGSDEGSQGEPNGGSRDRASLGVSPSESAADVLRQSRDELLRAVAGADPTAISTAASGGTDAPSSIGHADMSERIARLLKVQDAAGDRPLSQVMLRLERPDGGEDRLRVDLRGSTVSATLDVGDQAAADSLGANVKELQRALERHGFEAESLTVRTSARALESSTLARAAGAAAEPELQRAAPSSPNTSTNTSSRDRGTRHDEEQRQSPDSQRHRSRREQKGDRR